jgi:diguanylate cyclase (GGDEF)-like protein
MLSERKLKIKFDMADNIAKNLESPKTTEESLRRRRAEDTTRIPQVVEAIRNKTPEQIARLIIAGERKEQRAKKWAGIDFKTGLLTDKAFTREMGKQIELVRRDSHRGLTMALGDLDDFGIYNKMYGEHVGDMVLQALGSKFKGLARQTDIVSRYGGEEFAFGMPYSKDEANPVQAIERIRSSITSVDIEKNGEETTDQVSLTFGTTQFEPNDTFKTIFERAATALKIAKLLGKKRTVLAEHNYFRDLSDNKTYILETDGEKEILTDIQGGVQYAIEKNPIPKARPILVKLG